MPRQPPAPRQWLTPAEVAFRYGVSPKTVRRWLLKGIVAHVLVGPYHQKRIAATEAARHFKPVAGVRA